MADQQCVQVEAAPVFNRNLRKLAKKYRSIRNDLQPVIEQLEQGELPGDQIPGVGYAVFRNHLVDSLCKIRTSRYCRR
jgi:mRNA-degrading endonuclease RelE of RelBE toxin-antitoxin system